MSLCAWWGRESTLMIITKVVKLVLTCKFSVQDKGQNLMGTSVQFSLTLPCSTHHWCRILLECWLETNNERSLIILRVDVAMLDYCFVCWSMFVLFALFSMSALLHCLLRLLVICCIVIFACLLYLCLFLFLFRLLVIFCFCLLCLTCLFYLICELALMLKVAFPFF